MGSSSTEFLRNMKVLGLLLLVGGAYCVIPSCTTVWEDKCWDEPRQKCNTIQVPHEVTSYEEKCTTDYEQKCRTVWDTEVDYKPREECHTVQVPRTESVPEEECHTKYEEVCETTTETKTDYVTKNICDLEHE